MKMMLSALRALSVLVSLHVSHAALANTLSPDTILVKNDRAQVSKREFEIELNALVPKDKQVIWLSSKKNVATLLDTLLIRKSLSTEARTAKLDQDKDIQAEIELAVSKILARKRAETTSGMPSDQVLEKRALEIYRIDPAKYSEPDRLDTSHILVTTTCRSPAAAGERMKEIQAELAGGASFESLARKYSEDTESQKNGGRLGSLLATGLVKEYVEAAKKLQPSQVSPPVQTQFGAHLIKLHAREAGKPIPFETVKAGIIADLKKDLLQQHVGKVNAAIKADPSVTFDEKVLDQVAIDLVKAAAQP